MISSPVRFVSFLLSAAVLTFAPLALHATELPPSGSPLTVTGEVLDMACYLDHGAHGAKHANCARKCIENGLPVGLKTADGHTFLLIGEHMPANQELAKYAAKTITVRGKFVQRDGINLLENIEIVKS